jgi:cobalt-zinc-cadmium efflux system protein
VIWFTGWMPIDPILSLFVALLIVRSGWQIVRRSAHILLEGTPPGIDVDAIKQDIERIEGVREASHIHVWSLTSERPMATMHIRVAPGADAAAVLLVVKQQLAAEFGIEHSTVEVGWASSVEPGH